MDPNVFIRAPFRDCPNCGRTSSLGVLSVHEFLRYLEEIEISAPREHLDLVREVIRSSL